MTAATRENLEQIKEEEEKEMKETGKTAIGEPYLWQKRPLVSVIIPAYNCAGLISRAIESVLIQEVSLEIIVIDDGSGDNLEQVLETYRDNPAFSFIKNKTNLGAAGSRNKGVAMAKGRYVAFLDADDYWAAGKLKKQTDAMERTGCVLSCTARELMTPQGELTGRIIPVKEEITYRDLLHHNSINCSSVVFENGSCEKAIRWSTMTATKITLPG